MLADLTAEADGAPCFVVEAAGQGQEWAAKTWMITAKSLFPDNFGIQFEAYTTVKEGGQARESAAFLQDLFTKFPGEARIAAEIAAPAACPPPGQNPPSTWDPA